MYILPIIEVEKWSLCILHSNEKELVKNSEVDELKFIIHFTEQVDFLYDFADCRLCIKSYK